MKYLEFREHLNRLITRLKNDPAWPRLQFFNRFHLNSLEADLDAAATDLIRSIKFEKISDVSEDRRKTT